MNWDEKVQIIHFLWQCWNLGHVEWNGTDPCYNLQLAPLLGAKIHAHLSWRKYNFFLLAFWIFNFFLLLLWNKELTSVLLLFILKNHYFNNFKIGKNYVPKLINHFASTKSTVCNWYGMYINIKFMWFNLGFEFY